VNIQYLPPNVPVSTLMSKPWVNILDIRDGQQSTLALPDMVFDSFKWAKILASASQAGFKSAEIAGGQNFQSAISRGYNPFNLLEYMDLITKDEKGKKTIDLQMLFRGANALGFKHYSPEIIELTLNEFARNGITKIRIFDALNDIDNIYIPESLKKKKLKIDIQGALSFGHYASQPERYTDDYYVNYAQKLINKGCTSLAIKDMSGQLDGERAGTLVHRLKTKFPKIPLELHIHSTAEEKSKQALDAAIEAGIDGIETVEGPLSGGAAHHKFTTISNINTHELDKLAEACQEAFGEVAEKRLDLKIDPDTRAKLSAVGVPGGAMPFVMKDLKTMTHAIMKNNHCSEEQVLELFIKELPRVCADANYPLLVTPTADICCKQAIFNLAHGNNLSSDTLEDRYNFSTDSNGEFNKCDIRFVKLVLGHYGEMKEYDDNDTVHKVSNDVKNFFVTKQSKIQATTEHPYTKLSQKGDNELADACQKAQDLMEKYPLASRSFASLDQLIIMYALAPEGGHGDPIEKALKAYIERNKKDYSSRTIGIPFTEFDILFEPLFKHLDNLAVLGKLPDNPLDMKLKEFGQLGIRLFNAFSQMKLVRTYKSRKNSNDQTIDKKYDFKQKAILNTTINNLIKLLKSLNENNGEQYPKRTFYKDRPNVQGINKKKPLDYYLYLILEGIKNKLPKT
jgi:oxaloacetate decarboxylase alpha subunit